MPSATAASRSARVGTPYEFRGIQPLALVLRIALFLFKIFRRVRRSGGSFAPASNIQL